MQRRSFFFAIVLVLTLALAGCQGLPGESTPQQAVVMQLNRPATDGSVIDTPSIQIVQTQEIGGSTYVMASYRRMWNGRDQNCLAMHETHTELFGRWAAGSGGGTCMDREQDQSLAQPLDYMVGTIYNDKEQRKDISYVLGRTNNAAIVQVDVTWRDGQKQLADVVDGNFLAVREGETMLQSAVGLDGANQPVLTVQ